MRRQMLEDLSQKRRAFKRTISVDELLKPPKWIKIAPFKGKHLGHNAILTSINEQCYHFIQLCNTEETNPFACN